ncbi:MAG: hypothetical protein HPY51_06870 [Candidatus Omnitrophica bacterium]|nr:hypothetical protein [Candidatus Omnitrophota bacterium]
MRRSSIFASIGFVWFLGMSAGAQNPLAPEYHFMLVADSEMRIDGVFDDAGWAKGEWLEFGGIGYPVNPAAIGGTNWNDADLVCRTCVVHSPTGMYFACETMEFDQSCDDNETTNYHQWYLRDSMTWFFDFTGNPRQAKIWYGDTEPWEPDKVENFVEGRKWYPGEFIIAMTAVEDMNKLYTRRFDHGRRGGGRTDTDGPWWLQDDQGRDLKGMHMTDWVAVYKFVETYHESFKAEYPFTHVYELFVPWSSIETSPYSDTPEVADMFPEDQDLFGWELKKPDPLDSRKVLFTPLVIATSNSPTFGGQIMWVGTGDDDSTWAPASFVVATNVEEWPLF